MSKVRIYELAKELNVPSKKLVDALADLNLNVQNHMSTIDDQVADIIRDVLKARPKKAKRAETADSPMAPAADAPETKVPSSNREPVTDNLTKTSPSQSVPKAEPKKETDINRMADKNAEKVNTTNNQAPQAQQSDKLPSYVEDYLEEDDKSAKNQRPKRTPTVRTEGDRGKPRQQDNRRNNNQHGNRRRDSEPAKRAEPGTVKLPAGDITVGQLAQLLKRPVAEVIRKLIEYGIMAAINQVVDIDTATLVATDMGLKVEHAAPPAPEYDSPFEIPVEPDRPEELKLRPPVVTVMGHVDHGKTSLLDAIRRTNVTAHEAGGITQHIGAYQVDVMDRQVTFLDTPGHEAFTAMRARGARATDIAVLVVAADDGIMPQTIEAINHAKAAGVPIIVAVNKIDKPNANPDRVKQQLPEHGLVPEEWGGDTICVHVSAVRRDGIDDLLASILTVAEVMELKANPNKPARGVVIEAKVDKGRGPVATVLIHEGTLNVGDAILVGMSSGRIRAMVSDKGRRLKSAGPSTPVEIVGLSDVAIAGDPFMALDDEKVARGYADKMREKKRQEEMKKTSRVSLDDLFNQIQQGEVKELRIIVKADVQGSVEALRGSFEKLSNQEVGVKVIHEGVGPVNESDILLADASQAIIVGFNVRPDAATRKLAEQQGVDIRLYRVIYDAIEDLQKAMKGMLAPVFREVVLGQAQVRQVFKVTKVGTIAGSYVIEGKITRQSQVRLIRGGIVIYEGRIDSLKRFKDDAREVATGYECGIGLEKYNDIKEGDIIEAFINEKVEQA